MFSLSIGIEYWPKMSLLNKFKFHLFKLFYVYFAEVTKWVMIEVHHDIVTMKLKTSLHY